MESEQLFSVLIVDDDASNLNILNRILKERYNIYAAKFGKAALRIANEKRPDIILLDVILPDINGYEVLAELKSNDATRNIPVIIITALKNEENERTGFNLGAADYITKPFNNSTVKGKIDELLIKDK